VFEVKETACAAREKTRSKIVNISSPSGELDNTKQIKRTILEFDRDRLVLALHKESARSR
jgi:hypothetical protein